MSEQSLAIETVNLTRRYGQMLAVKQLNLQVPRQAIYGFIGPNGAGKTTTLRMLAGLLEPNAGEIRLQGQRVVDNLQLGKLVGYMPDFFGVYDDLRVWEYLDFFARCHNIPGARRKSTVDGLLELVDLAGKRNDLVQHLSRGMQQRLCLAHALVHDPPILLLDEPASGLDPQARIELRELLRTLCDMGKTVVLSSHILHDLENIATHIGIMARGTLLTSGSLQDVQSAVWARLRIVVLEQGEQALALLRESPGVVGLGQDEAAPNVIEVEFDGDERAAAAVLERLWSAGIPVADFHRSADTLERVFLQLVNEHEAQFA
jgi:ABC-2 type transport system ATP-binding protein